MKDCTHENSKKALIHREFYGNKFSFETLVCNDCGAELLTDQFNLEFNKWVSGLGVKPRVQFKMSHIADQCLEQVLIKFPGANKTIVVRGMIAVYLGLLKQGIETNEIFNQIFESEYYQSFVSDDQTKMFNTDVKAVFYLDIESWGKLFNLKPNEIASEAFHLMMALCISEDHELKEFWLTVILPQLENIIKAS